jgi:hypothetical protein
MSKTTIAILTLAAFLYAAWLVLLRRPLPDPVKTTGLRKRFLLAVLLFAGLLGTGGVGRGAKGPDVTCYFAGPPKEEREEALRLSRDQAIATLKGVWRALDEENGEEFRAKLEAAAQRGAIRQKVATMLAVTYEDLAFHKFMTRSKGPVPTCYEPTMLGGIQYTSRENAMKQLELLEEARKKGAIDEETAKKARAALAKEIEMLHRSDELERSGKWEDGQDLAKQYESGEITPGADATDAASIIVEMEGGTPAEPDTGEEK